MKISGLIIFCLIFSRCSEEKPSLTEEKYYPNTSMDLFQKQQAITTKLYYVGTSIYDGPKVISIETETNDVNEVVLNFILKVKNNTKDTIKEITHTCETWGNFLMEPSGIFNFSPNLCFSNGLTYRILPPYSNTEIPLHLVMTNKNFSIENIKLRIGYFFQWGFKGKSVRESKDMYYKMQVEIPTYWSNTVLLKDDYKHPDSLPNN